MSVFIGVDGGGSHTQFAVIDQAGLVLATVEEAGTNVNSVGLEAAKGAVERGLRAVLLASKATSADVAAICLCMSSVDRPDDKARVEAWVRPEIAPGAAVFVYNDAVAALATATGGELRGLVLISGTGTICVGFDATGKQFRSAGWGPLLGDIGSGYRMGEELLIAAVRAHDGRAAVAASIAGGQSDVPASPELCAALLAKLELPSPDQLIPWRYADSRWERVAALAHLVAEFAARGDPLATHILNNAATGLAQSVEACAGSAGFLAQSETFTLALAGKVLTENEKLRELLGARLKTRVPLAQLCAVTDNLAEGAAKLARSKAASAASAAVVAQ